MKTKKLKTSLFAGLDKNHIQMFLLGYKLAIKILRTKDAEKEFGTNYETEGLVDCVADYLETFINKEIKKELNND